MKISLVNLSVWIQFGCIKSFEILSQQIIIYSHKIYCKQFMFQNFKLKINEYIENRNNLLTYSK